MTAPIYGIGVVPLPGEGVVGGTLTLVIAPLEWQRHAPHFGGPPNYLLLLWGEAAIGGCMGLGISVFIHGMTLAGQLIGQASGLGMAEVFDPCLMKMPPSSRGCCSWWPCARLCIGGHRMAMAGLFDTFRAIPPAAACCRRRWPRV